MIKPEEIPNELEDMCQSIEWFQSGDMDKPAVAAILNAAIEAGVVSPAIWNVVDLASSQIVGTYENRSEAESVAARQSLLRRNCAVEHWKGQTE